MYLHCVMLRALNTHTVRHACMSLFAIIICIVSVLTLNVNIYKNKNKKKTNA